MVVILTPIVLMVVGIPGLIYIYIYCVNFLGKIPLLKGSTRGFDAATELSQKRGFRRSSAQWFPIDVSKTTWGCCIYQIQHHQFSKQKNIKKHLMNKKHFTRTTKKNRSQVLWRPKSFI